jgi:hypothetical protein
MLFLSNGESWANLEERKKERKERKKEIPYKEGDMKDIGSH